MESHRTLASRPWLFAVLGAATGLLFLFGVGYLLVPSEDTVAGGGNPAVASAGAGALAGRDHRQTSRSANGQGADATGAARAATVTPGVHLPMPAADRGLVTVRGQGRKGADPAADPQNAAVKLREVFDLWKAVGAKGSPPLGKRFGDLWDRLDKAWQAGEPLPPDVLADLQALVRDPDVQRVLDLLGEAARQPRCDFGLDYSKLFEMPLPHLSSMREMARLLTAAGWCDLQSGSNAAGLARFNNALALAEFAGGDPTIISHLVGIAIDNLTLTALSASDLGSLGQDAETRAVLDVTTARLRSAQIQSRQRLLESLAGEQEFGEASMQKAMTDSEYARKFTADMGGGASSIVLTPESLTRELAAYRRVMATLTSIAALPVTEGQAALEQFGGGEAQIPGDCPLTRAIVPALVPLLKKQWKAEALLESAVKMMEAVPRGEGAGTDTQR